MSQTVILSVRMSCEGCSGAVKRVLTKMEGVESFDIDMKEQKVTVIGNVDPEVVLQTVAKTGKKSSFWEEQVLTPDAKTEEKAAEVEAEIETEPAAVKIEAETEPPTAAEVEVEAEAETTITSVLKTEKKKAEEEEVVAVA